MNENKQLQNNTQTTQKSDIEKSATLRIRFD